MNTPFDTLFKHVSHSLPGNLFTLHQDLEQNLRVALNSALQQLDLVTREEFDVQKAVLARTRARLEALEIQVATLEAQRRSQSTAEE